MIAALGTVLIVVGVLATVAGGLWFLLRAFQRDVVWGIACFLTGIASLCFLVLHWNDAKEPFKLQLLGLAGVFAGALLGGF